MIIEELTFGTTFIHSLFFTEPLLELDIVWY